MSSTGSVPHTSTWAERYIPNVHKYLLGHPWYFLSVVQLYDQVQSAEIVLYNSGKVDMDFCVMGVSTSDIKDMTPGQISVTPLMVCTLVTRVLASLSL